MTGSVCIIDLGLGNVRSVFNAFERIGAEPVLIGTAEEVLNAERLVLPGVGNANAMLDRLNAGGFAPALDEAVRARGVPMLSICVGMQVLASRCQESGPVEGLNWYGGEVCHLGEICSGRMTVPHVGFADVHLTDRFPLRDSFRKPPIMYFNHSYGIDAGKAQGTLAGTTQYGGTIGACFSEGSWVAVQFHPEKSQKDGSILLEAFLDWAP